jgi:hypothetical protein
MLEMDQEEVSSLVVVVRLAMLFDLARGGCTGLSWESDEPIRSGEMKG